MNTRDLLELAALDALGLLEPEDQAEFERAFRNAPASVRAQIRAEQARAADLADVLPDVEPPAELRARVIAAVRAAAEVEAAGGVRAVVHRPGRVVPRVSPTRRVSPLWRAAAIGLSVAVLVLGVLANQLLQRNQLLGDQVILSEYFNSVGTKHLRDTLFNARTERVIFRVAGDAAPISAQAVLLCNSDWKTARFIAQGLAGPEGKNKTFQLCLVDDQNRVIRQLKRFPSDGRWVSFDVELPQDQAVRFALFVDNGTDDPGPLLMVAERLG